MVRFECDNCGDEIHGSDGASPWTCFACDTGTMKPQYDEKSAWEKHVEQKEEA